MLSWFISLLFLYFNSPTEVKIGMATLVTGITLLLLFVSSEAASSFDVPAMFAFGDSTLDTGNNNDLATFARSNFAPYGESFPDKKPTGRFSDGKIVPDFIVSALNLSDSLPAYAGHRITANDIGVCFASAATGLDDDTAATTNVLTIAEQVENFKLYIKSMIALKGEAETQEFLKKSLFLISIGANDIIISYYLFDKKIKYTLPQYHAFLLDQLKTLLRVI
jgi:GDSL-like Lipase/Acylhydrolase